MDLLLGPLFNREGDGVVLRSAIARTLTSLAGMCEFESAERAWVDERMRCVLSVPSLTEGQGKELVRDLGRVLRCDDGVTGVREVLFGSVTRGGGRGGNWRRSRQWD